MRILLSAQQSLKTHAIPPYKHWREYLVKGLLEEGHEILEVPNVDWAEGLTYHDRAGIEEWLERTWSATKTFVFAEHEKTPIDLFLSYFYPQQVDTAAIEQFQKKGIPCVNFFCDNVRDFTKLPSQFKPFALHWVPEFEALPLYKRAALPYINAPMPCWIPPDVRTVPSVESEPPTFIGSSDILRQDLLGKAILEGADFLVRGAGWAQDETISAAPAQKSEKKSLSTLINNQVSFVKLHGVRGLLQKVDLRFRPIHPPPIAPSKVGGPVSNSDYVRVTREASVILGVNRVPLAYRSLRRPLVYSRLRDLEVPMMGGCYLTEWTQGLEQMYELGAEIETYRTTEELKDKLDKLQRDASLRATMRQKGQRRALTDHTVGHSVSRIKAQLGI